MNQEWADREEQRKAQESELRLRLGIRAKLHHRIKALTDGETISDIMYSYMAQTAMAMLTDIRYMAKCLETHPDPVIRSGIREILRRNEERMPFRGWPSDEKGENEKAQNPIRE